MDEQKTRGYIKAMKLTDKVSYACGDTYIPSADRPKLGRVYLDAQGLLPTDADEPLQSALGCTFSPEICVAVAKAQAASAFDRGEAFAGTVACGLVRDPMKPSAAQLFSEDAFLTAELLKGYTPVGGLGFVFTDCLGQERFVNRTVDARALRELYLYPLAKAGMSAAALLLDGGYINGERCCSSREVYELLTQYIPETAPVFTQYGDVPEPEKLFDTGVYILGADGNFKRDIVRNVNWGIITESKIDDAIERMMAFSIATHDKYAVPETGAFENAEMPDLARECSVLLKNDGLLPAAARQLTFFGDADKFDDGKFYDIRPIKSAVKTIGTLNVFLITDYETDGIDAQTRVAVQNSIAVTKTVVVMCGGCATELGEIAGANAVLFCPYRPFVGDVIEMLTDGDGAPRGHLPFTWASSAAAYPCNNKKFTARGDFRYESLYNGHLLFDNFKSEVLFPFGHGLDYTEYTVSKLKLSSGGQKITAEFIVKNSGMRSGDALLQAYVTLIDAPVYGLEKRLAAFKKVRLDPTENEKVSFQIDIADLAVYDANYDSFITVGGKYRVEIGLSSADIRVADDIKVAAASRVDVGLNKKFAPSYFATDKQKPFSPTAPEIERLLKVPFIKKPDEFAELKLPTESEIKKELKRAQKLTPPSLFPIIKYKLLTTPAKNRP